MSLLEIDGLTHSFGENVLYKNAGFTLNKGEHIGIVGQNGTGKSTLIKICTEQIIPDSGRIVWQPNTTVGYLDQYAEIDHSLTMKEFLKSGWTYKPFRCTGKRGFENSPFNFCGNGIARIAWGGLLPGLDSADYQYREKINNRINITHKRSCPVNRERKKP